MEEGCHIVLRNVSVNMVGGYLRLSVSKWGKVSLHPDGVDSTPSSPSSIDEFESNSWSLKFIFVVFLSSNDMSNIEYELVQDFDD